MGNAIASYQRNRAPGRAPGRARTERVRVENATEEAQARNAHTDWQVSRRAIGAGRAILTFTKR